MLAGIFLISLLEIIQGSAIDDRWIGVFNPDSTVVEKVKFYGWLDRNMPKALGRMNSLVISEKMEGFTGEFSAEQIKNLNSTWSSVVSLSLDQIQSTQHHSGVIKVASDKKCFFKKRHLSPCQIRDSHVLEALAIGAQSNQLKQIYLPHCLRNSGPIDLAVNHAKEKGVRIVQPSSCPQNK